MRSNPPIRNFYWIQWLSFTLSIQLYIYRLDYLTQVSLLQQTKCSNKPIWGPRPSWSISMCWTHEWVGIFVAFSGFSILIWKANNRSQAPLLFILLNSNFLPGNDGIWKTHKAIQDILNRTRQKKQKKSDIFLPLYRNSWGRKQSKIIKEKVSRLNYSDFQEAVHQNFLKKKLEQRKQ